MNANLNIRVIDNPINNGGGITWNRLHCEREEICEALLREGRPNSQARLHESSTQEEVRGTANWHCELLQARLRKIDDALDRLMSASYGNCIKCGRWLEDTELEFDPAIAFCPGCWEREQSQIRTCKPIGDKREIDPQAIRTADSLYHSIKTSSSPAGLALGTLAPFDTIHVRTLNSEYRIFLLDPRTGRALVDGGPHFVEPVEALVCGSSSRSCTIRNGEICIGLRIEMWVEGRLLSTSTVQSVRVEHYAAAEPSSAANPNLEMQWTR